MREPEAGITSESRHGWWQWGVTILFLLWQVAFQFAYGFFAEPIQAEFSLTAAEAAAVSSVYLLAYGLMQVPAGLLLDRFGVRWLLPIAAFAAAAAVLFFAQVDGYPGLLGGRIVAGGFMAFIFPATGRIARTRLPASRFVLAMAMADMCFGVGAVLASGLPSTFAGFSWREMMHGQGLLGLALATLLVAFLTPVRNPSRLARNAGESGDGLWTSIKRPSVLLGIGIYSWGAGLTFGFGGYWNLKLQESCGCTAPQVSELSTGLFAGLALGMLVAGILGGSVDRRRAILRSSTLLTFALLTATLWLSASAPMTLLMPLMVALGITLGTCSLSFAVAILGLPTRQAATVVALVNAAGCLSGSALQELPVLLGGGSASLLTVAISYLGTALAGIVFAWCLPSSRTTGDSRQA